MTWLVTGGAGYVGAHVVRVLRDVGTDVVVLDDLSTGVLDRLPADVPVVTGSLLDGAHLDDVFARYPISGVVHLAAKKRVDESVAEPLRYFHENLEGLRGLLARCAAHRVRGFIFSSSAAVYGTTGTVPVTEAAPCDPISPYGQTKLAGEWLTHSAGAASGMQTVALRYFNVAGAAAPELADTVATNLIPLVLVAISRHERPVVFGADHLTPDGTCVRDYIHVADVADAHLAAVRTLERGHLRTPCTLNVGTGRGVSVREVIDEALRVTGSRLRPAVAPRRAGDPPAVVADVERAARTLRWRAGRDLTDMVASAWAAYGTLTRQA